MPIIDYEDQDALTDIGKALKKEKTQKKNFEKIEAIKEAYIQKQEEEQGIDLFPAVLIKWRIALFLFIILLVAVGLRLYVASMPLTDQWAELVVEDNLKNQVMEKVYQQYPTLSDAKKNELISQGTTEALAAQQNQDATQALSEQYKQSYKDPEGNSYLYEIDPYYFYEIAKGDFAVLLVYPQPLLPLIERGLYIFVQLFIPTITLAGVIFYLPLLFTIFCAITLFFLTKEIWNATAAFFSALFFVSHPLVLEFSMLGFVDTNMLNIFFILLSGLLFIYLVKQITKKEENKWKKYLVAFFLLLLLGATIFLFKKTWSAWYIGMILLLISTLLYSFFLYCKKLYHWKEQNKRIRAILIIFPIFFLLLTYFLAWYGLETNKKQSQSRLELFVMSHGLQKYLHLDYDDPYGEWPDAFALIKELKQITVNNYLQYSGGMLYALLSFFGLGYFIHAKRKNLEIKEWYLFSGFAVFLILSLRAIRLLPYFIPFFAITLGITVSIILTIILNKISSFLQKEKKSIQFFVLGIFFITFFVAFAYPLSAQILERSKLMPIMDDAIYNSAMFIKENSTADALVSTWWDRGTFYKALTEREVHMHSQPHMPRTYWLSLFYTTNNEGQAKNIISMLNCGRDEYLLSNPKVIMATKEFLAYANEEERPAYISYLNETFPEDTPLIINSTINCDRATTETYIVVIDDLMPRFSSVQYFAAWNFETQQPDFQHPYTDLAESGCIRSTTGAYCQIGPAQYYLNFTSLEVQTNSAVPEEVFLVYNGTVQHAVNSASSSDMTLLVYNRDGYWKAQLIPKVVADSMYIKLMLLDGYNSTYFEKVFDEVHVETSWVKVYKVRWEEEE